MQNTKLPLGLLAANPQNAALVQQQSSGLTVAEHVAAGCVLLVDKASGWTSHDVVARTRRACGTKKVGHAGTLDPLATGLLTLGVGPATRLLTHLVGLDKVYTATVRLGQQTVTDDAEGEIVQLVPPAELARVSADPQQITAAAARLTGTISQVPTAVSAIKVDGKRAYDLVRDGVAVQLRARTVQISKFAVSNVRDAETAAGPAIDFDCEVMVSSGTYVRALARDLGADLGVFGHLTALRRTAVGPFAVGEGISLSELDRIATEVKNGNLEAAAKLPLVSAAAAATAVHGAVVVDDNTAVALGHGKQPLCEVPDTALLAALNTAGRLLALVEARNGKLRVVTGFPQSG